MIDVKQVMKWFDYLQIMMFCMFWWFFTVISDLSVTPDRTDKYWRCESLRALRLPSGPRKTNCADYLGLSPRDYPLSFCGLTERMRSLKHVHLSWPGSFFGCFSFSQTERRHACPIAFSLPEISHKKVWR